MYINSLKIKYMSRIKEQIDYLMESEIIDDSDYLYQKYVDSLQESPLQSLIDKMFFRINEDSVTTKKLAQIIEIAYESREGLLEPGGLPENDWWANQAIKDFTEIIVRANFKAHSIINPGLVTDNLDEQISEALEEISKKN